MGHGANAVAAPPCPPVAAAPTRLHQQNGAIATTAQRNILSCQSGDRRRQGSGKTLTTAGQWTGQCTTIPIPAETSVVTHNITYHWTHRAQCNWEKSHATHDAGQIISNEGVDVCGSSYCPHHGSYLVIAVPK
jgi:hypothetical protein